MLLTVESVSVKMVATCFITSGLCLGVIVLVTWLETNIAGVHGEGHDVGDGGGGGAVFWNYGDECVY